MGSRRGAVPKLNPFVLADLFQGLTRFDRPARTVPLDEPWRATGARDLDGQTLDTWIRRNLRTPLGRAYFRIVTEAVYAAEPTDLSVLHAALLHALGHRLRVAPVGGRGRPTGPGGRRLVTISERMADELDDRVRRSCAVRRSTTVPRAFAVTTRTGESFDGDR